MAKRELTPMQREARDAYAAGLSVVPVATDGSKRPGTPGNKWKAYQRTRATREQAAAWWGPEPGLGYMVGAASNGIAPMLEFDCPKVFEAYGTQAAAVGLGDLVQRIRAGYEDATPRDGRRWLLRCADVPPGEWDRVWAQAADKKALIESTMFAILAPSTGVHPSGHRTAAPVAASPRLRRSRSTSGGG